MIPLFAGWAAAGAEPVHYSSFGPTRDTAILFVHGWTCDESLWRFQCPALTANGQRRLLTIDLPGHGRSAVPAEDQMSMNHYARAMAAVMDRAAVETVVAAGHSMGTPVIRQFARLFPKRVRGLILVDGTIYTPQGAAQARGREGLYRGAAGLATREKVTNSYLTPYMTPGVKQQIRKVMLGTAERTAVGAMRGMLDLAIWQDESPVSGPVLAIYQKGHPLAPAYLRKLFPQVEYHALPRTGHFLMMERPAEFNALVDAFARRLEAARDR